MPDERIVWPKSSLHAAMTSARRAVHLGPKARSNSTRIPLGHGTAPSCHQLCHNTRNRVLGEVQRRVRLSVQGQRTDLRDRAFKGIVSRADAVAVALSKLPHDGPEGSCKGRKLTPVHVDRLYLWRLARGGASCFPSACVQRVAAVDCATELTDVQVSWTTGSTAALRSSTIRAESAQCGSARGESRRGQVGTICASPWTKRPKTSTPTPGPRVADARAASSPSTLSR